MATIKPPMLHPGDTIGIVTLGSPLEASIINERIQTLRDHFGFQVVLGENVYSQTGFLAGSDEQRAADLMQMFASENVKMILPTRGGVGVSGILPFLDYSFIEEHPKIISGYSDITVLLNTLAQKANLITFQSLLLLNFRNNTPSYNYNQFFEATSTITSPRQIVNPSGIEQISKVRGHAVGPIVGGNITSLVDTLGTPYEIDTTDRILLLEDTNEPANTIYRYLSALKLAGKFDDCAGVVMGQCTNCPVAYGTSYEDVIDELIVPLGKPLMTNVTTAHGTYKAAIPIGATVSLDTTNDTLTVLESTVRPS